MLLLDTNVVIYAAGKPGRLREWARGTIAHAVAGEGAAVNAVSLAEICAGAGEPGAVAAALRDWGITLLDVPAIAAPLAAEAYRVYRSRTSKPTPAIPLPDFFIGAHAVALGWDLATADKGRFNSYFPDLPLRMPE